MSDLRAAVILATAFNAEWRTRVPFWMGLSGTLADGLNIVREATIPWSSSASVAVRGGSNSAIKRSPSGNRKNFVDLLNADQRTQY